jgi:hypothetical protein
MSKTEQDRFVSAIESGRDVLINPLWTPPQAEIVRRLEELTAIRDLLVASSRRKQRDEMDILIMTAGGEQ